MRVFKFGGASVKDPASVKNVAKIIRDHHGTYLEYRELKDDELAESKKEEKTKNEKREKSQKTKVKREDSTKKKLTFNERKEFKKLEKEIHDLEAEKSRIEVKLSSGELSTDEITESSARYAELIGVIEEKTLVWMEMAERDIE